MKGLTTNTTVNHNHWPTANPVAANESVATCIYMYVYTGFISRGGGQEGAFAPLRDWFAPTRNLIAGR